MSKIIAFDLDAKKKILKGLALLVKTVKNGSAVIRRKDGGVEWSHDLVFIARMVHSADPFENLGISVVFESALKTFEMSGEGFLETILTIEEKFREGMEKATSGTEKELDTQLELLLKQLAEREREIQINLPSTLTIASGYASPYFVTCPSDMSVVLEDPYVYVTDHHLRTLSDVIPLLEHRDNLLIVSEHIDGEALATLVINHIQGGLKIVALKTTQLNEIARQTGGKIFSKNKGSFGRAKQAVLTKDSTQITSYSDHPTYNSSSGCPEKERLINAYTTAGLLLTTSAMVAKKPSTHDR